MSTSSTHPRFLLSPPSRGFEPGPLAAQLSRHTPVPIPYKEPFNWGKLFQTISIILFGILALRWIGPILTNRWVWAAGTIATSLVMTGGYMFTKIRNVPYVGADGGWIAGGYQNQFGQEVQVVAFLCRWYGYASGRKLTRLQTASLRSRS